MWRLNLIGNIESQLPVMVVLNWNTKYTSFKIHPQYTIFLFNKQKHKLWTQDVKKLKKSHGNNRKVIQRLCQGQNDNNFILKSTIVDCKADFGATRTIKTFLRIEASIL